MRPPPPPSQFKPAGDLLWARFAKTGPKFYVRHRISVRQKMGIKFEEMLQWRLSDKHWNYVPRPWLQFMRKGEGRLQHCQPDGLMIDVSTGTVTVVEMKLAHTTDAWWQMRQLYVPVLRHMFPPTRWQYRCVTIVRFFDPTIQFPEPLLVIDDVLEAPVKGIGVIIEIPERK